MNFFVILFVAAISSIDATADSTENSFSEDITSSEEALKSEESTGDDNILVFGGCDFPEPNFYVAPESPRWGEVIDPVVFTQEKWDSFILDATELYHDSMQSNNQNEFDDLLDFITFVQKSANTSSKSLEEIYNDYNVEIILSEESASFVTNYFASLVLQGYGQEVKHAQTVPSYVDIKGASDDYDKLALEAPGDYFHGHIAGFLKFKIQTDDNKSRPGYILWDFELSLAKPVIIMEDGQAPHSVTVSGGKRKKIEFALAAGGAYITAKVFGGPQDNEVVERRLYYVAKTFCSFSNDVIKRNQLLKPRHSLVARDADGNTKYSLEFNILPVAVTNDSTPTFSIYIETESGEKISQNIDFHKLKDLISEDPETEVADKDKSIVTVLEKFSQGFEYLYPSYLLKELNYFDEQLFSQPERLADFYNLNKKLKLRDDETTGEVVTTGESPETNLNSVAKARKILNTLLPW